MRAWHFVRLVDGKPTLRDGRPMPARGEWLEEAPPIVICQRGLHGSWRALDALYYVDFSQAAACLVEVDGVAWEHADKFVASRRLVVDWVPCDDLLRLFARESALSVAHHWTMPPIVREYLEAGREEIRAAAWAAAMAAARDAAWPAAVAAARDAARAAAWAAAWPAAVAAARDAARAAAWAAAWAADWDADWDDLNRLLESILLSEMEVS